MKPRTGSGIVSCVLVMMLLAAVPTVIAGPDPVALNNNVATATGNQQGGIASGKDFTFPPGYTDFTLNINNLTTDITPAEDVFGIVIWSEGAPGSSSDDFLGGQPGGPGGNGLGLTLNFFGDPYQISTNGDRAHGILVVSWGGAGGNGNEGVGDGGGGGAGGIGRDVTVENYSEITTMGVDAYGIFATSEGGDGGKGGGAGAILNAYGGDGGTGANAGHVMVYSDSEITTNLDDAYGIFALSQGGNGGGGEAGGSLGSGNGGGGGAGGIGRNVTVESIGAIITRGNNAHGIFAQSQGGDGGAGAGGGGGQGNGGDGGAGASAGDVTIDSIGAITTTGNNAYGIFAQSQGGDAGDGAGGGGGQGNGGDGGAGASAGDVTINSRGAITTTGNNAYGIFAQSQSGDGGAGAGAGGGQGNGGDGGTGASAGDVTVNNDSPITTDGERAHGIVSLSQGGDGGNGSAGGGAQGNGGDGGAGGIGGDVTIDSRNAITTRGNNAFGIFAQNQGGNGGIGAAGGGAQANGGHGGAGASGSDMTINNRSVISTYGEHAHGIFSLSQGGDGGGGGNAGGVEAEGGDGGAGAMGGDVTVNNDGTITTNGAGAQGIRAQSYGAFGGAGGNGGGVVAFGGGGSDSGKGGNVNINSTGGIETSGTYSYGIFAQSVGGFGGSGGASGGVVAFGGMGETGGDGGAVIVTNSAQLQTSGEDSTAIFAQSVGGGGGSVGGSGAAIDSIGGDAGSSGDGNTVTVVNSGRIITDANRSQGIFAQSVGGGGGSGGGSGAAIWSVGGNAGTSGNGGAVSVTNSSRIETSGDASGAIVAQSIGGGGGTGSGDTSDDDGSGGGSGGFSIAYSYGGTGSSAGDGGDVEVTNSGVLTTSGQASSGIFAQSVGGGGGKGEISRALAVSVGGDGGSSGNGGNISVENTGAITTRGDNSYGILAQSVGGGGGSTSDTGYSAWSCLNSTGGKGASGGDGGSIDIMTSHQIETCGENSSGILAQSVGGGGGSASDVKTISPGIVIELSFATGGDGGAGGDGNNVTISSSSDIVTHGQNSHGIIAQSIGGGGGNAGNSTVWSLTGFNAFLDLTSPSFLYSIGGNAGSSGDGSAINVESSGNIVTSGSLSHGILAQSIGGGGGNEGSSSIFAGAFNGDSSIKLAIGGDGGAGGNGGVVDVNSTGVIVTQGVHSSGILAQSIGGGGGTGGDAEVISVNLSVLTDPEDLLDLHRTLDFMASIGGSGGASGDGGTVNVVNSGSIFTEDEFSSGILAQSIGGGGGTGGHASSYEIEIGDPISAMTSVLLGLEYDFTLGGDGGAGGKAGHVTVTNSGDIITKGAFATGITAQSIGGGGGAGGNVLTVEFNNSDALIGVFEDPLSNLVVFEGMSMVLRGSGGSAGDGGNVTVTNSSDITTDGAFAHGILAQSIGGGGGSAGMSETGNISSLLFGESAMGVSSQVPHSGVWFAGSLGGVGSGGSVTVNQTGDITTRGNAAHGIFAQSVGLLGQSGKVSVTLDGDIHTEGIDSDGIFAQSIGGMGCGNISVNILNGTTQGGSEAGAGVHLDGWGNNTLTNAGNISSLSGIGIRGGIGNDIINNNGVVTGNVNLGVGNNTFNNNGSEDSEALFNAGSSVYLGAGRPLNNSGTLSPGGSGTVLTTDVTGNLTQTSSGTFLVDLDLDVEQADRLNVSGSSNLAGSVSVNVLNKEFAKSGTKQTTIISSAGGVTNSGLSLLTEPSAVIDYELLFPNATDVDLQTTIDFSPSGEGLTGNQGAIGNAINTILSAGDSPSFEPYGVELLNLPDAESVGRAYDQLSPESYDALTTTTFDVTGQYAQTMFKRMHSLRSHLDTDGRVSGARQTLQRAAWIDGFGQWGDQNADVGFTGFEYSLGGVGLGFDYLFDEGVLGGISFGQSFTNINLDNDRGHGDIKSSFGSLYGSWFSDQAYLDMALSYGRQSYDNSRRLQVGGLTRTAQSDHDGDAYSAYVEMGCALDLHEWVLQPFTALHYTYLDEESYREAGAGGVNLLVQGRKTDSLVSELGLRFYGLISTTSGDFIPEASLAWSYDFDIDNRLITAAFDGAPDVAFSIENQSIEKHSVVISAGITFLNRAGTSLFLKYGGEFRDNFQAHGLFAGLRYEF